MPSFKLKSSPSQPDKLSPPGKQGRGIVFKLSFPRVFLIVLILVYFLFSGLYAVQRHLAFETSVFDTGVYTQPLWNFIHGHGFIHTTMANVSLERWGNHVEPVLFLLVPLYALLPDPRTLFWLQAAALSLAAWPLYALATRRLQSEGLALAIVLAYFLLPATQAVTLFDFHAVSLAPLFLLAAIYFLDRALEARGVSFWLWPPLSKNAERPGSKVTGGSEIPASLASPPRRPSAPAPLPRLYFLSSLCFLLALSTKEDISLHVVMIGLYLLILRRRWQEGVPLILVSLAWFYVVFQLIIPAYRTGGEQSMFTPWFETLGDTPWQIALSPLTRPEAVLALIFRPSSLPALSMLTVPLALLPIAGLPLTVLAAPSIALSLLSENPTLRQLETWHYAAPMLPFLMLGTIDGLARLRHYGARLAFYVLRLQRDPSFGLQSTLGRLAGALLVLAALGYHAYRGYTPLSQLYRWPAVTAHHELGRQIAATIPPEASLLAQAELIPHVSHRRQLAIWDGPLETDFDYIWLDLSHPKLPNRYGAHDDLLIGLIYEHSFGPVVMQDGYLLLKNGADRVPISEDLFSFTRFNHLPANAQPLKAAFGPEIRLVGVQPELPRLATSNDEPQLMLYFETLEPPAQDYFLFVYRIDQDGSIDGATDYAQPAIFWWPTSRWQTGQRYQVRVNTVPWWTGDKERFGYAIGFSRINDPWAVAARLPVSSNSAANPEGASLLDGETLLLVAAFRRWAGLIYEAPLTGLSLGYEQQQVAR